jgi:hypothetical protein
MKAAIARAQEKGAVRFLLAHLCGLNEGLGRLYERSGFHPVEQLYVKEF